MLSLIYVALPVTLLMFSSVISYVLSLLLMVMATLAFIVIYCTPPPLLLLVIITVYIGAMITLFVYVSAVTPNDFMYIDKRYVAATILVSLLLAVSVFTLSAGPLAPNTATYFIVSSEMFSGAGVYLTGFLTLVLLLVLLVSTYSTPHLSMFRALK